MLSLSAEAGDGVEVMVKFQSIFSENARIGVLLEGLILSFNGCRIFRSSRMQISRIPKISNDPDSTLITTWDWVIQGLDVHICMPYRLELRAIDDSVEDQLRALKLIMAAKKKTIEEVSPTYSGNMYEVIEMSLPPAKGEGKIFEGADSVPELVKLLREEAKVI